MPLLDRNTDQRHQDSLETHNNHFDLKHFIIYSKIKLNTILGCINDYMKICIEVQNNNVQLFVEILNFEKEYPSLFCSNLGEQYNNNTFQNELFIFLRHCKNEFIEIDNSILKTLNEIKNKYESIENKNFRQLKSYFKNCSSKLKQIFKKVEILSENLKIQEQKLNDLLITYKKNINNVADLFQKTFVNLNEQHNSQEKEISQNYSNNPNKFLKMNREESAEFYENFQSTSSDEPLSVATQQNHEIEESTSTNVTQQNSRHQFNQM